MNIINVILSGGIGSRLWPLSRKSNPKQYLEIFDGKSLFELTILRNSGLSDKVLVVGNVENEKLSDEIVKKITTNDTKITETVPRNTAAAIAFAAFASEATDILIITPSDHVIIGEDQYKSAMESAIEKAKAGYIVTFGVRPTRPETGYGYIEFQDDEVISFREKPNLDTAEGFIEKGTFLWNSGMFCFQASVFLEELKTYEPKVYEAASKAWSNNDQGRIDEELSLKIPSISVDYAVMERSKKIRVIPAEFSWSDLGSFESLYEYLKNSGYPIDQNGNMILGTSVFTSFVGLQNVIFVSTPDAFLILQKEKSQDIKKVYNMLEKHRSKLID